MGVWTTGSEANVLAPTLEDVLTEIGIQLQLACGSDDCLGLGLVCSSPMEVAGLGRPMCFGPHTENFADVVDKLVQADAALQISTPDELPTTLAGLLSDGESALAMGRRAREIVRQNVGATAKTVGLLCESLGRRSDYSASSISTIKVP